MPGPKEQSPDEVQHYLQPIVSDLLQLWKHGIKIPTESQPEGIPYSFMPTFTHLSKDDLFVLLLSQLCATNLPHTRWEVLHHTHTLITVQSVGYL